ncbi:chaplin [Streptomyces sp. NPDC058735]|uniref:chaplin n=1 Tax=unclassified Streptomyces TaxID=2593676 RepID=UPI0036AD8AB5
MRTRVTAAIGLACAALLATAGAASADEGPVAVSAHNSGVLSGNIIQIPLHIDTNICGNTFDTLNLFSPPIGNRCSNEG